MLKHFYRRALVGFASIGMLALPFVADPPAHAAGEPAATTPTTAPPTAPPSPSGGQRPSAPSGGGVGGGQVAVANADSVARHIHTDYGGHWIDFDMYAHWDGSNTLLWASATVHAGALAGGNCVEFWHNINLWPHRSADLIVNCEANTTRTYPSFWLWRQDGQIARITDVDTTDPQLKGINVCVTDQRTNRRILGQTCFAGFSTYTSTWGNGTRQWGDHPEPWQYDGEVYNYDQMLNRGQVGDNCGGCTRIRWLAGDHWNHDLSGSDRVVDPGTSWSSYYGVAGQNNRFLWIFQGDGNLVVYRIDAGGAQTPIWSSGTYSPGAKLRIQADGNLVIWQQATNDCIWNSNTWGKSIVRWANGHNGGFYGYTANGTQIGIYNQQYC